MDNAQPDNLYPPPWQPCEQQQETITAVLESASTPPVVDTPEEEEDEQQQSGSYPQKQDCLRRRKAPSSFVQSPATTTTTTTRMFGDTDDELVYEAIEQVRRWKERPNQTRITGYLRKRHKIDQATTERLLDDMVRRKRVCRVWYMDDVTYRSLEQHKRCPRGSPLSASSSRGSNDDDGKVEDCDEMLAADNATKTVADSSNKLDKNHFSSSPAGAAGKANSNSPRKMKKVGHRRRRRRASGSSSSRFHPSKKRFASAAMKSNNSVRPKVFGTDGQTPPPPPPTYFDMNEDGDEPEPPRDDENRHRPQMRDQAVQSGEFDDDNVQTKTLHARNYLAANGSHPPKTLSALQKPGVNDDNHHHPPRGKLRPLGPKPPQQTASSLLLVKNHTNKIVREQQQVASAISSPSKQNDEKHMIPRVKRKYCRRLIPSSLMGVVPTNVPKPLQQQQQVSSSSTLPTTTNKINKKRRMKKKRGRKRMVGVAATVPNGSGILKKGVVAAVVATTNVEQQQHRPLSSKSESQKNDKFPTKFGVLNQLRKSYGCCNADNEEEKEKRKDSVSSELLNDSARYLSAYERRVASFLNRRRSAALDRSWRTVFGSEGVPGVKQSSTCLKTINLLGRRESSSSVEAKNDQISQQKTLPSAAAAGSDDKVLLSSGGLFLQQHSM